MPGVHTGVDGHEQAPQVHVDELHVCDPYVLHACVAFGAQAPCPAQPLLCHPPIALHVCVSVPQLPQPIGYTWPGAQTPLHVPLAHVWPLHGVWSVCVPPTHVHGALLTASHPVCPGAQLPAHAPVDGLHVEPEHACAAAVCTPPTHVHGVFDDVKQPTDPVAQLPAHDPAVHVAPVQGVPGVCVPLTHVQGVLALHPTSPGAHPASASRPPESRSVPASTGVVASRPPSGSGAASRPPSGAAASGPSPSPGIEASDVSSTEKPPSSDVQPVPTRAATRAAGTRRVARVRGRGTRGFLGVGSAAALGRRCHLIAEGDRTCPIGITVRPEELEALIWPDVARGPGSPVTASERPDGPDGAEAQDRDDV